MATPGALLQAEFDRRTTHRAGLGEVDLFTELKGSLPVLGNHPAVRAAVYHGTRSLVEFDPDPVLLTRPKTCELADLLVLTLPSGKPVDLRLTLLQAKYAKKTLTLGPPVHPNPRAQTDAYQWDLLARRRRLRPVHSFQPPADLLASARLPSVGSYGVFHDLQGGAYGMVYVSADLVSPLTPLTPPAQARTMTFPSYSFQRYWHPWVEAGALTSIQEFGDGLVAQEVGTVVQLAGNRQWDVAVVTWLRSVVRSIVDGADDRDDDAGLAREALEDLGDDAWLDRPRKVGRTGHPNVLLVRSEPRERVG